MSSSNFPPDCVQKFLPKEELLQRISEQKLDIAVDSRMVKSGGIFIVLNENEHAEQYITDAVAKGAGYIVTSTPCPDVHGAVSVIVDNPRHFAACCSAAKYDTEHLPFPLVGVTGTNGKTSVTYLLERLFVAKGLSAGVIGTIAERWNGHNSPASMTTPDAPVLHGLLHDMRVSGVQAAAMEVSSHALEQERVDCIPFAGAVFTNLTQDHLDYHKTFENYFAAKRKLFFDLPRKDKAIAVGTDNPWGERLAQQIIASAGQKDCYAQASKMITFGCKPFAGPAQSGVRHLLGTIRSAGTQGIRLAMTLQAENEPHLRWEIFSPLVGAFNAENLLAVQAVALGLGFTPDDFECFTDFYGVPGRMERIINRKKLDIFVDYAHTPDALINALSALRNSGFKRIICIFGCGGDRDKLKRPLMGQAVADNADIAIVTSDNPRSEDPMDIISDIKPGLVNAKYVTIEPDRKLAIALGIETMRPGDALLVAGKGHETTQQIGTVKHHFSDQETIRELCQCL